MCVISAPLFFFCWHCLQPLFGFSSVLASLFHCCSFVVVFLYCQLLMCVIYLHLFNTGVTFTDSRWRHAARQISLPSTFSIHFYSFVVQPNKWLYLAVMCPSHFCRVRVESESQAPRVRVESESSKIFSSRVRVMTWSSRVTRTVESLRVIGLQAGVNVESQEASRFLCNIFLLWNSAR